MRPITTAPPVEAAPDVEPPDDTMAFAAGPAIDVTKEAGQVDDSAQPPWWADLRATLHDPILARVTRLTVADPMVMPLKVARDQGGDEPVVDDDATRRIVPELASPLADRFATWGKYVTLIAGPGRAYWVRLYPEDIPSVPDWPTAEQRGGWVVVSPFNFKVTAAGAELVLDGGHKVTVARDRMIVCQRSGRFLSGEPYSELRTLAEPALLADRVRAAMWARSDTSAQATKVLSIGGGDARVATSRGGTSDPKTGTVVQSVMGTLAKRLQSLVNLRRDAAARAPMVVSGRGDNPLAVADMTVDTDTGLVDLGEYANTLIAIGAGVPTAQLTGESPKFANMFADRLQFARSESGILAREVAAAALPLLASITRGTADAGTIWWLDPSTLIGEALEDAAAARGTFAAAPDGDTAPLAQRVNTVVSRVEQGLFADAELLTLAAPDERPAAADRMAVNAVDALAELLDLLDGPAPTIPVGDVRRAALASLEDSLEELGTEVLAAAIGLPTIVGRLVESVKDEAFGVAEGAVKNAPILTRKGISAALDKVIPDAQHVWVYGLPSSRPTGPYEPHRRNAGRYGSKPGDFTGDEPDGEPCFPGGHKGCQCFLEIALTATAQQRRRR